LTLAIGAQAAEFISRRDFAAYLPDRTVKRYLDDGKLHLVSGAPSFPYPTWFVWRNDISPEILMHIDAALIEIVKGIDTEMDEVFERLKRFALTLNQNSLPSNQQNADWERNF